MAVNERQDAWQCTVHVCLKYVKNTKVQICKTT